MFNHLTPLRFTSGAALLATLLLSACGGGGGGTTTGGDVFPGAPATIAATAGPDSFLLFPNPQKQFDGALQVDALEFANAYYAAIDPANERDTLVKFKAKNGFGTTGPGITEETIIIGDQRDLGYGRKMTGRQNADGTIAFVVENYLVGAYGAYTPFNLEAAIQSEAQWHIGTNGIEFSPGPGGTVSFVKFYTFAPLTGTRLLKANLDGRGDKAMPTVCMSCHGGRGDALTPTDSASGQKLFNKVMNLASQARGDVAGQLHAFEPASFDFSSLSGFTRASLEAKMKTLNKLVLCAMPLPNGTTKPTPFAEDDCRRVANPNEYQGAASEHLKNMYGGNGLPNATTNTTDTFVPSGWQSAGQSALYLSTVTQSCRVCHALRGNGNQSDISFETFAQFDGYSDRIKAHVVDRGNMPLAKLVYDKYWSTPSIYAPLGNYLVAAGYADGNLMPGRPVADPGPDRVIKSGSTTLSAAMSLYSSTYRWRVTSGAATLSSATDAQTVFTATGGNGTYTVELVTGSTTAQSTAKTLTIVVDSTLATDPAALRFGDIKTVLQGGAGNCLNCHVSTKNPATQTQVPPVFYDDYDRSGTGNSTTNLAWLYNDVRGRINFTDIVASPLLRKPAGNHHGGGPVALAGFDTSRPVGNSGRADYDKLVGWILNGAPQ